jgi:hypothetical protein
MPGGGRARHSQKKNFVVENDLPDAFNPSQNAII